MHAMKRTLVLLAVPVLLGAIGCSSLKVYNDYDDSMNFAHYRTYRWLPRDEAAGVIPLYDKRIRTAVDHELANKGFEEVENGPVDLIVSYEALLNERIQVRARDYYWHGYYPEIDRYQEGTLVIDLVDYTRNQLVWRAWASGVFDEDPRKANEQINEAVYKIFKRYPPHS